MSTFVLEGDHQVSHLFRPWPETFASSKHTEGKFAKPTSDEGKVSADAHTAAREFESLTPPPHKKSPANWL